MIVQESDSLRAALDRRLQIDPVLALDRLQPVSSSAPRPGAAPTTQQPVPGATALDPARPFDRLPLGGIVTARVVSIPTPEQVVAEIGSLRVTMAWPGESGSVVAGNEIALRVLALRPMLLFQRLGAGEATGPEPAFEPSTHWSDDVLRLQATGSERPVPNGSGLVRFDEPILELEFERVATPAAGSRNRSATTTTTTTTAATTTAALNRPEPQAMRADGAPALLPASAAAIALGDVIVAREAALVDGIATPLVPRMAEDGDRSTQPFVPLVLNGPAWHGQPVELVVRRERADEQFDNAALDRWCGELLIDLPHLGRVAGHLSWSMQGLRVRMEGSDDDAIAAMNDGSAALANALAQVDLRVTTLSVGGLAPDTRYNPTVDGSASVTFGREPHA